jgi:hypothetical protein
MFAHGCHVMAVTVVTVLNNSYHACNNINGLIVVPNGFNGFQRFKRLIWL